MSRGSRIIQCSNCGKDIRKANYDIGRSEYLYCSRECMKGQRRKIGFYKEENNKNWKGGLTIVNCHVCNKELERKQCAIDASDLFLCSPKCRGIYISDEMSGENSWAWQGGKTDLTKAIRGIAKYKEWMISVFERDNYQCTICASNDLQAHHIKQVSDILNEYGITSLEEAKLCEELWDVDNGETLCVTHHAEFHKQYGKKHCSMNNITEFKERVA